MSKADPVAEIAHAQGLLGLRDWQVSYDAAEPEDEDCAATVYPVYGRKVATIRVSNDWFGYDASVRVMSLANRYARLLLATPDADDRVNGTKDWRERQRAFAATVRDHADGTIDTDQAIARHKALNR